MSLFLTASIVIQKEPALKAALLALWMGVIERLTGYHKDFFTANALINGICVSQVSFTFIFRGIFSKQLMLD